MALPSTGIQRADGVLFAEVARCCELARGHEKAARYEDALAAVREYWGGVGESPKVDGLSGELKAEILLRAGMLTSRIGSARQIENSQETAKNLLTESLLISDETGDKVKAAEACHGLALCFYMDGAFSDARVWIRSAADRIPTHEVELSFKVSLLDAIVLNCMGEHTQALALMKTLGAAVGEINDPSLCGGFRHEYGITLDIVGVAEGRQDYLEQALIEYEGAKYHLELAGRTRGLAHTENDIGVLLHRMGRNLQAIPHTERAIESFERLKDKAGLAQALDTKARVCAALNCYEDAEKTARRSVRLLRFGGQNALLSESLTTLGVVLIKRGAVEGAGRALLQAEQAAAHVGDYKRAALAALARLEELSGEDFEGRRVCHSRLMGYLSQTHDASLATRHGECLLKTFLMLPGAQTETEPFSWDGFSLEQRLFEVERGYILQALKDSGGKLSGAAKLLKVSPANLNFKLKTRHKDLKHFQNDTRRRTILSEVKPVTIPDETQARSVEVFIVPDHSLSGQGIRPGDRLVIKSGYELQDGRVAVLRAGVDEFIGVCELYDGGVTLLSDDDADESLSFNSGSFEVVGVAVGYVKAEDASAAEPKVHAI